MKKKCSGFYSPIRCLSFTGFITNSVLKKHLCHNSSNNLYKYDPWALLFLSVHTQSLQTLPGTFIYHCFKQLLHLSPQWSSCSQKTIPSDSVKTKGRDKFTVPKWGRNYTFVPRDKHREFLSSSGHWPHQEGPPTPWQTWSSFQGGGEQIREMGLAVLGGLEG